MRFTLVAGILGVLACVGAVVSRSAVRGGRMQALPPTGGNAQSWLQTSAPTDFGTNLSMQTVVSSVPTAGAVTVAIMPVVTTAGVGCTKGGSVDVTMNWTAPGGTSESYAFALPLDGVVTLTSSVLDEGSYAPVITFLSNQNTAAFSAARIGGWETSIVARAGTAITYNTNSALPGSCTTIPEYTVFARASQ